MDPEKTRKEIIKRLDNILKRILKVPQGTPREVLYIETNLLDGERIIEKKRLSMLYRTSKNKIRMNKFTLNENTEQMKETQEVTDKYEINRRIYIAMKPRKANKFVRRRIQQTFRKQIFEKKEQQK